MPKQPDFDVKAAHRYFSAHCFNAAWELIEKKDRTPEEDRQMVSLNQASLYHWRGRRRLRETADWCRYTYPVRLLLPKRSKMRTKRKPS
jgi:hypothetical protein